MFDSQLFQPGKLDYFRVDFSPQGVRAVRDPVSGFTLATGPRDRLHDILGSSDSGGAVVYLLEGQTDDGRWAREGLSLDASERIPAHWRNDLLATCDRISVFTSPTLTKGVAEAVECLLARQLAHVQQVDHLSAGPTMPRHLQLADWKVAYGAFLHLRSMAPALSIAFLEPDSARDIASFQRSIQGYSKQTIQTVHELRSRILPHGRAVQGMLYRSVWGDYRASALQHSGHCVLLAGSQIRKKASKSAHHSLHAKREKLFKAKELEEVAGFPDRALLRVDLKFRSHDAVNKFFRGGGGRDRWEQVTGLRGDKRFRVIDGDPS